MNLEPLQEQYALLTIDPYPSTLLSRLILLLGSLILLALQVCTPHLAQMSLNKGLDWLGNA